MTKSFETFNRNIDSVNIIDSIYLYFDQQVKALDMSEIVRAQYVLIISAFDYYIHDIIREGMIRIFEGKHDSNMEYEKFAISIKTLHIILSTDDANLRKQILDMEIRNTISKHSYQAPSNVERALALINIKNIWSQVSRDLNKSKGDVIKQLGLIIHRRNKIAHEADVDPISSEKSPIDRDILIQVKDFICRIVASIDSKVHIL